MQGDWLTQSRWHHNHQHVDVADALERYHQLRHQLQPQEEVQPVDVAVVIWDLLQLHRLWDQCTNAKQLQPGDSVLGCAANGILPTLHVSL